MAQSNDTSWYGASIAVKTININTNAALGTLAEAILAAVEVNLENYELVLCIYVTIIDTSWLKRINLSC